MTAKRALYPPKGPLAKRVKRVEAMARANRPEMQTITTSTEQLISGGNLFNLPICLLEQGPGVAERSGTRVRVWRIEVRGLAQTGLADLYLIQQHGTDLPALANFGPEPGAFLLDKESNTKFTEWRHYRNADSNSVNIKFVQKFKGMHVKYNGALNTPVDNGMNLVYLNRGTGAQLVNVTVRVWFTNA